MCLIRKKDGGNARLMVNHLRTQLAHQFFIKDSMSSELRVWKDPEINTLGMAHEYGVPASSRREPWAWISRNFYNNKYSSKQTL